MNKGQRHPTEGMPVDLRAINPEERLACVGRRPPNGCPDDAVCRSCPCASEDDVCFPGERLRAERDTYRVALGRIRDHGKVMQEIARVALDACPSPTSADGAQMGRRRPRALTPVWLCAAMFRTAAGASRTHRLHRYGRVRTTAHSHLLRVFSVAWVRTTAHVEPRRVRDRFAGWGADGTHLARPIPAGPMKGTPVSSARLGTARHG